MMARLSQAVGTALVCNKCSGEIDQVSFSHPKKTIFAKVTNFTKHQTLCDSQTESVSH